MRLGYTWWRPESAFPAFVGRRRERRDDATDDAQSDGGAEDCRTSRDEALWLVTMVWWRRVRRRGSRAGPGRGLLVCAARLLATPDCRNGAQDHHPGQFWGTIRTLRPSNRHHPATACPNRTTTAVSAAQPLATGLALAHAAIDAGVSGWVSWAVSRPGIRRMGTPRRSSSRPARTDRRPWSGGLAPRSGS